MGISCSPMSVLIGETIVPTSFGKVIPKTRVGCPSARIRFSIPLSKLCLLYQWVRSASVSLSKSKSRVAVDGRITVPRALAIVARRDPCWGVPRNATRLTRERKALAIWLLLASRLAFRRICCTTRPPKLWAIKAILPLERSGSARRRASILFARAETERLYPRQLVIAAGYPTSQSPSPGISSASQVGHRTGEGETLLVQVFSICPDRP